MQSKRRQDTCTGKGCPFWTRYGKNCPNYQGGVWEQKETKERYETHDCAPKRTMILCQQIYDGMEKVLENYTGVRNANHAVLVQMLQFQKDLPKILNSTDAVLIEDRKDDSKLLEG